MQADIALIKHLLSILRRIGDAGMEELSLMIELEIAAGRPLTTATAKDTLLFAADKGWTSSRCDDFDRTVIWLTERGKTRLAGL